MATQTTPSARSSRSLLGVVTGTAASLLVAGSVHADIIGFPVKPGWQVNKSDGAAYGPVDPPKSITLTTGTVVQARSAFYEPEKQNVAQFEAKFTYQFSGTASNGGMGSAFVLHNMPGGAGTVGGSGYDFGYGGGSGGAFQGPSMAVSLEANYLKAGSSSSGVYSNGFTNGGGTDSGPVNFFSGHAIDFVIKYDGTLLKMTATDTVTGGVFNAPTIQIDIPAIVGGDVATVGFTGSTNSNAGTSQTFSNFSYTAVPSPAAGSLLLLAAAAAARRRR